MIEPVQPTELKILPVFKQFSIVTPKMVTAVSSIANFVVLLNVLPIKPPMLLTAPVRVPLLSQFFILTIPFETNPTIPPIVPFVLVIVPVN